MRRILRAQTAGIMASTEVIRVVSARRGAGRDRHGRPVAGQGFFEAQFSAEDTRRTAKDPRHGSAPSRPDSPFQTSIIAGRILRCRRRDTDKVAIINQSVAQRLFPQDAVNRRLMWTDT